MTWWPFAIAWAVLMSLDAGLMPAFAVGRVVPQAWPVLLAFVALHASRQAAFWSAAAIGLWLDASHPAVGYAPGAGPVAVHVFGPNVLACAAAAWGLLELRVVLYRRNLATVLLGTVVAAWIASLAFVAVGGIRSAYADPSPLWGPGSGAATVGSDFLAGLWSAAVGILPAWALQATYRWWDFATAGPRFGSPGRLG